MTGGDTVDSAPAWIPGEPKQLLFQSSGLARNEQGYVVAQGHASIQLLDMETGYPFSSTGINSLLCPACLPPSGT